MQQNTEAWKRWVKKSKEDDKNAVDEGPLAKSTHRDHLNMSTTSKKSDLAVREPFVYNHKPKPAKQNVKETNRTRLAKEIPTFGASIETLDFSDNELNDVHGQQIVALIKATSEKRDNDLWLSSLRRQVAEDHLQAKKEFLNT